MEFFLSSTVLILFPGGFVLGGLFLFFMPLPANFASDLAFKNFLFFFFFILKFPVSGADVAGEPQVMVKVPFVFLFGPEAGITNKLW